jgi:IS605 OrfB family transposase
MPTPKLYGKTTDQGKALIGDAAVRIADLAKASSKPIVIENLDFSKKKAEREATHKPLARMLSSFARNKVIFSIKAAALRRGITARHYGAASKSLK